MSTEPVCARRGHRSGGIWSSPNGSTWSLATSPDSNCILSRAGWGCIVCQGNASLTIARWIKSRQMVGPYGGMSFHNNTKSPLVPLDRNVNEVVYRTISRDTLVPFASQNFGENFPYQDENATPHHARVEIAYVQQDIKMDQPSRSPGYNPIKYLWNELGRAVNRLDNPPQLQQALLNKWAEIPVGRLQGVATSMPRSLAAIIRTRGGSTQYCVFIVVEHWWGKPTTKDINIGRCLVKSVFHEFLTETVGYFLHPIILPEYQYKWSFH